MGDRAERSLGEFLQVLDVIVFRGTYVISMDGTFFLWAADFLLIYIWAFIWYNLTRWLIELKPVALWILGNCKIFSVCVMTNHWASWGTESSTATGNTNRFDHHNSINFRFVYNYGWTYLTCSQSYWSNNEQNVYPVKKTTSCVKRCEMITFCLSYAYLFNLCARPWNKLQLLSPFRFQPDLKPTNRRWIFAIELAIKSRVKSWRTSWKFWSWSKGVLGKLRGDWEK